MTISAAKPDELAIERAVRLPDEGATGVSHFGIQVEDLERSLAFYEGLLGLQVVFRIDRDDPYIRAFVGYPEVELRVAVLRHPESEVFMELMEYRNVERQRIDGATANPGTVHICFYVSDLDAVYRRLTDAKVDSISPVMAPVKGLNVGGKAVYMIDPDGVRVELLEARPGFLNLWRRPPLRSRLVAATRSVFHRPAARAGV